MLSGKEKKQINAMLCSEDCGVVQQGLELLGVLLSVEDYPGYFGVSPETKTVEQLQIDIQKQLVRDSTGGDQPWADILFNKIEYLEFSVRTSSFLFHNHIYHVHQLVIQSEYSLIKIKNLGRKSLNEIKNTLKELGLSLSMNLSGFPGNMPFLLYISCWLTGKLDFGQNLKYFSYHYGPPTVDCSIPEEICLLPNLEWLWINVAWCKRLPAQIGQLKHLQSLGCNNTQLQTLPRSLSQLPTLTELDLGYNQLTSLPEEIADLVQLETLDLRSNAIAVFPRAILRLTKLRRLNLSDNALTEIPSELAQLPNLEQISAHGNPLTLENKKQLKSLFGKI